VFVAAAHLQPNSDSDTKQKMKKVHTVGKTANSRMGTWSSSGTDFCFEKPSMGLPTVAETKG